MRVSGEANARTHRHDPLAMVPDMFHSARMQARFDFCGHGEIECWSQRLAPLLAGVDLPPRRSPVGQLVKSMISSRTRDAVSLAAYHRLVARFGSPAGIAAAESAIIAEIIADVTFPEAKAEHLVDALRRIAEACRGYRLDFLAAMPLDEALAWLERLPGVARKVAASTLNASTLDRPVFIVDSHVQRVLRRLGLGGPRADIRALSEAVTAAMPDWSGGDFLRFHVAVKRLGQRICRFEAPSCAACPLAGDCPSRLT
jgi:endonuclease III